MPGILGVVSKLPSDRARKQVDKMLDTVCHESFYVTGTWSDESLGIYAPQVR